MKGSLTKKATAAVLAAALLASASPVQAAESYARDITITVDGRTIPQTDQKAFIKDSRTMVPLRTVMEGLNMGVEWNNENRSITVKNPAKAETYTFYADKPYFLRYKKTGTDFIKLDVAPYVTAGNRTIMPLRAIGETYGKVDWNNATSTVIITGTAAGPTNPVQPTPPVQPNVQPTNPVQPNVKPQQPSSEANTPGNPFTPQVQKGALTSEELAWLKDHAQSGPQAEEDLARYEAFKARKGLSSEEIDLMNAFWRYVPEFKKLQDQKTHAKVLEDIQHQSYVTPYSIKVFEETNNYRAMNGLKPLKLSPFLCKAASIRANECLKYPNVKTIEEFRYWRSQGNNSHTRPNGMPSNSIMRDLGYSWDTTGENLLSLYNMPLLEAEVAAIEDTRDLYESPGHRANMLNPNFTYMGAARAHTTYSQKSIQFFCS